MRIRWVTPTFVKYGEIKAKRKRSLRVQFDGESRTTVIPDALWYYCQHKVGDKENGLAVWEGEAKPMTPTPNAHDRYLPAAEVAHSHGVSPKDLRRWLRSGKVHGYQEMGLWLVDEQSLGRFLADR